MHVVCVYCVFIGMVPLMSWKGLVMVSFSVNLSDEQVSELRVEGMQAGDFWGPRAHEWISELLEAYVDRFGVVPASDDELAELADSLVPPYYSDQRELIASLPLWSELDEMIAERAQVDVYTFGWDLNAAIALTIYLMIERVLSAFSRQFSEWLRS